MSDPDSANSEPGSAGVGSTGVTATHTVQLEVRQPYDSQIAQFSINYSYDNVN